MPIFEYVCKQCSHEFEVLVFGEQKAECPKCQSKKLEPQLSVFAVSAKSGAGPVVKTRRVGEGRRRGKARGVRGAVWIMWKSRWPGFVLVEELAPGFCTAAPFDTIITTRFASTRQ